MNGILTRADREDGAAPSCIHVCVDCLTCRNKDAVMDLQLWEVSIVSYEGHEVQDPVFISEQRIFLKKYQTRGEKNP